MVFSTRGCCKYTIILIQFNQCLLLYSICQFNIIPVLQARNNIRLQVSISLGGRILCMYVTTDLPVRDVQERINASYTLVQTGGLKLDRCTLYWRNLISRPSVDLPENLSVVLFAMFFFIIAFISHYNREVYNTETPRITIVHCQK